MKKTKLFLTLAVVIFTMAFFNSVQADEGNGNNITRENQENIDKLTPEHIKEFHSLEAIITTTEINIYDAGISFQEENNLGVRFSIYNAGKDESKLRYAIKLLEDIDDKQEIKDTTIYDEVFDIKKDETIKRGVDYIAPSELSGKFQVWVDIFNKDDIVVASAFVDEISLESDSAMIPAQAETENINKNKISFYRLFLYSFVALLFIFSFVVFLITIIKGKGKSGLIKMFLPFLIVAGLFSFNIDDAKALDFSFGFSTPQHWRYTANLNKTSYAPGESMILSGSVFWEAQNNPIFGDSGGYGAVLYYDNKDIAYGPIDFSIALASGTYDFLYGSYGYSEYYKNFFGTREASVRTLAKSVWQEQFTKTPMWPWISFWDRRSGIATLTAPTTPGNYNIYFIGESYIMTSPDDSCGVMTVSPVKKSISYTVVAPKPTGNISAVPNPCAINAGTTCSSAISWTTSNVSAARVVLNTGAVFANNTVGSNVSADWITAGGYTFNLYDWSSGSQGALLDSVFVRGNLIYACIGVDPANTNITGLCSGDDINLMDNTLKTAVSSCTPDTKCEYTCKTDFNFVDGNCVAVACPQDNACLSHTRSAWFGCTATCGGGTGVEYATCDNGCSGIGTAVQSCTNNTPCPSNGGWREVSPN